MIDLDHKYYTIEYILNLDDNTYTNTVVKNERSGSNPNPNALCNESTCQEYGNRGHLQWNLPDKVGCGDCGNGGDQVECGG